MIGLLIIKLNYFFKRFFCAAYKFCGRHYILLCKFICCFYLFITVSRQQAGILDDNSHVEIISRGQVATGRSANQTCQKRKNMAQLMSSTFEE